ncbi:MAG: beta-phosphoglucomutase [Candidatus Moranbacteria bacterium]|nr:beta-phosphoglucomutase [Candidatus Moranbacteria bacterium]
MKAVIFDLDGVILSTDDYHYQAWKKMADEEGVYFDRKINNRLRGVSRMESLNIILEKAQREYGLKEKHVLCERKNGYYRKLLNHITSKAIFTGAIDFIEFLKNKGYKVAIGSSSKNATFIVKRVGLEILFDAISDGNNIIKSKPDPEVFIKAAEMLKIDPKDCVVVEDAKAGIDAGNRAKMKTIAVGEAVNYKKADYSFSDINKIDKNLF